MMDVRNFLTLVFLVAMVTAWDPIWLQPEQIHLSATGDPTQMTVTWTTFNDTQESTVQFGFHIQDLSMKATGNRTKFVDGGSAQRVEYIHRVLLSGLKTGQMYLYRCGSNYGWSSTFGFRALPNITQAANGGIKMAVFGDMGNENAQSLGRLQTEAQSGLYNAVLHVGDFAYNFYENNGTTGDEFMRQIESVAAYVPYMTCAGNHEQNYNFSHYKNRFTMPKFDEVQNLWYSWDVGPAHIIAFSTEVNFYVNYGFQQMFNQKKWLEADLEQAAKPENRAKRPWIITMGHRPMYCTTMDDDDCTHDYSITRHAFEDLFYKYGVDIELWAHEHIYESFWPIYNYKVLNGSTDAPYTNPKAPVHIVTGSAGCREKHDTFQPKKPFVAVTSTDYGYTRMTIVNSTHVDFEQVSDDKGGRVVDRFTVIKNKHGPEAWL